MFKLNLQQEFENIVVHSGLDRHSFCKLVLSFYLCCIDDMNFPLKVPMATWSEWEFG